jgi:hypothetical protein
MFLPKPSGESRDRRPPQAGDLILFDDGLLGMIRAVLPPTGRDPQVGYFVLTADQKERFVKRPEFLLVPANLFDLNKPDAEWVPANFLPDHFAKIQA